MTKNCANILPLFKVSLLPITEPLPKELPATPPAAITAGTLVCVQLQPDLFAISASKVGPGMERSGPSTTSLHMFVAPALGLRYASPVCTAIATMAGSLDEGNTAVLGTYADGVSSWHEVADVGAAKGLLLQHGRASQKEPFKVLRALNEASQSSSLAGVRALLPAPPPPAAQRTPRARSRPLPNVWVSIESTFIFGFCWFLCWVPQSVPCIGRYVCEAEQENHAHRSLRFCPGQCRGGQARRPGDPGVPALAHHQAHLSRRGHAASARRCRVGD